MGEADYLDNPVDEYADSSVSIVITDCVDCGVAFRGPAGRPSCPACSELGQGPSKCPGHSCGGRLRGLKPLLEASWFFECRECVSIYSTATIRSLLFGRECEQVLRDCPPDPGWIEEDRARTIGLLVLKEARLARLEPKAPRKR
jgi:hypothetical protein